MKMVIADTECGKVQGVQMGHITIWRGIPYAKAPVGPLRFRPPQPLEPWKGVRDATRFGAVAFQKSISPFAVTDSPSLNMSEDCLFLNIWAPVPGHGRHPVMVWIHGGAFNYGHGSEPEYDGASFARQGVVLITLNYRLGPLGFMYLDEISGGEYKGSGNCGLLDQIAALRWIRSNIASFGGDPDNVTIFGESAGARSVSLLLGIPEAQGLFRKAIIQSAALRVFRNASVATETSLSLMRSLGLERHEWHKLKDIPAKTLIECTPPVKPTVGFEPTIDGTVLSRHPMEAIAGGASRDVEIIIGTNRDEMRLPNTLYDSMSVNQLAEEVKAIVGPYYDKVASRYVSAHSSNEQLRNELLALYSWHTFHDTCRKFCEYRAQSGKPVWTYRFDWRSPLNGTAFHALEIPFVFHNLNTPEAKALTGYGRERERLSLSMQQAWVAFARTGNPNHAFLPHWPKYELSRRSIMIFDEVCRAVDDPDQELRLLWEKAESGNE